jgi:hypothetical protein
MSCRRLLNQGPNFAGAEVATRLLDIEPWKSAMVF